MKVDEQIVEMVVTYLTDNHEHIKELVNPLTLLYSTAVSTDPLFKEDVDKQYQDNVCSIITNEVTKRLGVSTEDVLVVLEGIDLKEYLK